MSYVCSSNHNDEVSEEELEEWVNKDNEIMNSDLGTERVTLWQHSKRLECWRFQDQYNWRWNGSYSTAYTWREQMDKKAVEGRSVVYVIERICW